jgi:hypothetical protein
MHTVEIAGKPIAIINSPKGHAAIHAPLLRARGARRRAGRRPGGRRPDLLRGRRSGGFDAPWSEVGDRASSGPFTARSSRPYANSPSPWRSSGLNRYSPTARNLVSLTYFFRAQLAAAPSGVFGSAR